MSEQRLIVVVGATDQGCASAHPRHELSQVKRAAVSTPDLRQPSELAVANVHDTGSLDATFAGAHAVFGMTANQKEPGELLMTEEDMKHDIVAGKNMINAAKKNGVKHFVFSSLPDIIKGSNNKFKGAIIMNNKVEIEKLARRELDGYTGIIPGNFFTNLHWPMYTRLQPDGSVRLCDPIGADKRTQWLDGGRDTGLFVARIFALGVEKTKNKNYIAGGKLLFVNDIMETFTHVTGGLAQAARGTLWDPASSAQDCTATAQYCFVRAQEKRQGAHAWA
ncbi:uncharacterized protein A1O9_07461 [Exophiala aquamarina CBS 119918]|uniref:NmrA-like domain-containing protein n=1 Tax=Exophiala aquamarina CBS 119918 TaxID=1182545 RepID=A0A072P7Q9_9EURO|nr:uncharacterized protein A1O9_07461 [Exophiala aquamarina CBS 119918]KEF55881.1 hypothetical protein A1O9_07461 [Exophiala aquamarina CBS 119918]